MFRCILSRLVISPRINIFCVDAFFSARARDGNDFMGKSNYICRKISFREELNQISNQSRVFEIPIKFDYDFVNRWKRLMIKIEIFTSGTDAVNPSPPPRLQNLNLLSAASNLPKENKSS